MSTYIPNNQAFLDQYGPVMTCDELATALIQVVNDRLVDHAREKNTRVNSMIGFHWEMTYSSQSQLAERALTAGNRIAEMGGYTGKVWFRFEYEFVGNPAMLFKDTGYLLGVGGYSTWNGPWQQAGLEFNRWETGVPHNQRTRPLAAFAFSTQFYIADFPGIDQTLIMDKISDQPIQAGSEFSWSAYDLGAADQKYIDYLKSL